MTYVCLIFFLLANLIAQYSYVQCAADPSFQKEYDAKVCSSEPTCNLTTNPNLSPDKLTFPWRDCMCDFECSEYDDCCKDSQYFKAPKLNSPSKTYYCSPELKVYMVVSCLPDYTDERVKANCVKALKPLEENNFALILPVTNPSKRITYANAYCALCNNDENFEPWLYASGCGEPPQGYLEQKATTVKKESSTESSNKISNANSGTTMKPNSNRLNINVHLNPGAVFGNNDPNAGFNKEINIPTFGNIGSKTVGSQTGIFGIKTKQSKRQANRTPSSSGTISYYPYARKINELMKIVKYDPNYKEFIANYEGKTLVCKINTRIPDSLSKQVRQCFPNLVSECPNNSEANKLCQSYMRLVHDLAEDKSYRNVDCAKCNGVDPNSLKLTGCYQNKRVGASSLFANDGKGNPNNEVCNDPKLAAKLC